MKDFIVLDTLQRDSFDYMKLRESKSELWVLVDKGEQASIVSFDAESGKKLREIGVPKNKGIISFEIIEIANGNVKGCDIFFLRRRGWNGNDVLQLRVNDFSNHTVFTNILKLSPSLAEPHHIHAFSELEGLLYLISATSVWVLDPTRSYDKMRKILDGREKDMNEAIVGRLNDVPVLVVNEKAGLAIYFLQKSK